MKTFLRQKYKLKFIFTVYLRNLTVVIDAEASISSNARTFSPLCWRGKRNRSVAGSGHAGGGAIAQPSAPGAAPDPDRHREGPTVRRRRRTPAHGVPRGLAPRPRPQSTGSLFPCAVASQSPGGGRPPVAPRWGRFCC